MVKLLSNTLEISVRKRNIHLLYSMLEYLLIISITSIAIVAAGFILANQLIDNAKTKGTPITISTLLE